MHTGLALLLVGVLFLAGGLEKLERHDHGPLTTGHECAACQIAGTPAELSIVAAADATILPPDPGAVPQGTEALVPDARIPALLRLRSPPLT